MTAQYECGDVLHGNIQRFREETTHTCRVQDSGHADHAMFRKSRAAKRDLTHRIEWVRDDYENGVGRALYDLINDLPDNIRIRFQKIVTTHSRFAGETRRNDNDV